MSGNRSNDTGQISVAELLARNGQKVGTRAGGRRRRGAGGGISVAELTGEIPVTRPSSGEDEGSRPSDSGSTDDRTVTVAPVAAVEADSREPEILPVRKAAPAPEAAVQKSSSFALSDVEKTTVTPRAAVDAKEPPVAAEPKVTAEPKVPSVTAKPSASTATPPKIESPTEIIRPEALPRRARAHLDTVGATASRSSEGVARTAASGPKKSENAPIEPAVPVSKPDVAEPRLLSGPASDLQGTGSDADAATQTFGPAAGVSDPVSGETAPSTRSRKSRSKATAADDSARVDADDETSEDAEQGSSLKQWVLLIGESLAAIVAGGLLFKGFERLWDLMPWIAFALALLVIVGLVALVRVLRRTDDIASQLIALAVGAFVSFGPLLFLLPGG
ncbi:hypothetical protein [Rhodococcus sp. NPDC047139]|uniref:hypothetical protein n=1 Tax=Rhodococcus sp. NPDC047139 TaxID=3155141 RepID=UPI0033EFEB94